MKVEKCLSVGSVICMSKCICMCIYRISFNIQTLISQAKYLSNLIDRYKEWSFQLYPSFEYTEVLNRTYAISKEPAMKHMVEQLRRQECDRRMVS